MGRHDRTAACNHCGVTNLANLDRVAHQNLRVQEELALSACKDITMCAVTPSEVPRLIIEYPVVFTKNSVDDQYVLVALFGVDPQRNLFWRDGRWQSLSLPLNLGRQPFFVGAADNRASGGEPSLVTLVDLDNPGVKEGGAGESLFDAEGKETPYLRHKLGQLAELIEGERRGREFTGRMLALEMIRPIQLELKAHGEQRKVGGLYTIDERKLRALAPEVLAEFNGKGWLHVIYAMLSSLGQLQILASRAASLA